MFATTVFLAATLAAAQDRPAEPADPQQSMFEKCAKACADCMLVCDSCARHCVELVAKGKKEHVVTAGFCADCANVCSAAAQIVARGGPLRRQIVEACAASCEQCAKECKKYPDDDRMRKCAQECQACAKVCRALLALADQK